MEHKTTKSFGSLTGEDSLAFTSLKDNDESGQRISDERILDLKTKPDNKRETSISNDFDIISLIDKDNNKSTSDPSSSRSSRSSRRVTKDKNGNEVIEIEVNDSFILPSDDKGLFCPVRKLLIIGLKNWKSQKGGKPTLIAQYPNGNSRNAEKDYGNLIYAWFPNDIEIEVFSEKDNKSKLFSHSFVYMISTDGEGTRSYCTFLNFYELVLKDNGLPMIVPKSIWVISNECLYESQTQFLQIIFKNVIFVNNIKSILALYDDPMNYLLNVSMAIQWEIKDDWQKYTK